MPDRMDLPFVGLATFARQPACTDWDKLDGADVAVLGIPIDTASSYRVGTRFGPRAIREVSMFHGFGPEGVFDFEDEVTYLTSGRSQDRRCRRQRRHLCRHQAQPGECRTGGARAARRRRRCPTSSAATMRSPWRRSPPIPTRSRSTSSISTRISISSTSATASPGAMAARCAGLPRWRM